MSSKTPANGCADQNDIPIVTVSPTYCRELSHIDSYPNLKQSASNLSLDRGLTASPIPWRDASMEVLVSPNDAPQISIEDFDDGYTDDSPFPPETSTDFDTVSMCDINSTKNHSRLYSENSNEIAANGIDKIIDRKFACYGVSPRLTRKTNDFLSYNFAPIDKERRPKTLNFLSSLKDTTPSANTGENKS